MIGAENTLIFYGRRANKKVSATPQVRQMRIDGFDMCSALENVRYIVQEAAVFSEQVLLCNSTFCILLQSRYTM